MPAIQALRALALLAVAAGHVRGAFLAVGPDRVVDVGGLEVGVDVFSVVSGFIMLHVERDRGAAAAKTFVVRRAVPIVPLCWVFTTLAAVAELHRMRRGPDHLQTLWRCVASYLFWPQPGTDPDLSGSVPGYPIGWTLNCAAFFMRSSRR